MTVKLWNKKTIRGQELLLPEYKPKNLSLTKARRMAADELDKELIIQVGIINEDYDLLPVEFKKNEYKKWKWLGGELERLFKTLEFLDKDDIRNEAVWPAIGQYLRPELKRGLDTRRAGTRKDHYRKCWLLATLPYLDWIGSWSGWDAFVDRGDQLVLDNRLLKTLHQQFVGIHDQIKPKDYQRIAKYLAEEIPSGTKTPKELSHLTQEALNELVARVYHKFMNNQ